MRDLIITAAGVALICVVGSTGHIPATPDTPPGSGCTATVIAEDGTPPPGTPHLDPAKACDALHQAEQEADCMGDAMPSGDRVNARQLCLAIQRHGCGNQGRDCTQIPEDQTYYTHH